MSNALRHNGGARCAPCTPFPSMAAPSAGEWHPVAWLRKEPATSSPGACTRGGYSGHGYLPVARTRAVQTAGVHGAAWHTRAAGR